MDHEIVPNPVNRLTCTDDMPVNEQQDVNKRYNMLNNVDEPLALVGKVQNMPNMQNLKNLYKCVIYVKF